MHLVDQEQGPVRGAAELEFGVGNDDPARRGVIAAGAIDGEAQVAEPRGELAAQHAGHAVEGHVLVVPALGLGGGREERRIQPVALRRPAGSASPARVPWRWYSAHAEPER